tara:strand:- start:675 stop:1562 length:888 start_codon:yes stop_codon:yes gene_type:complete
MSAFSQYQQSQLGVSAAKARAISERSQAQFRTGLTAVQEKEALERAADQLEQIAKEAEKNARKRGRRVSFGRLIGSTIGFALGGPAGKAALGTALGSLAGSTAAGGFKKYDVDVPDSLVPGGVFYGREREKFQERADDLEEAFEDLTKSQRMNIGKNVLTDYLTGRSFGKLGEAKVGDLGLSLDDLLESGQLSKKDYLKDILRSAAGGIGEDRIAELAKLSNITPTGTAGNLMGAYGNLGLNVLPDNLAQPLNENLLGNVLDMDFEGLDEFNFLQNNRKKRNSLFQQTVGPMGGI